ncbi:MAG: autoinducer binding domain protein [Caudoviricetes sp.]|nr:MAG: autoinducer binding domain protein [Caudoviricetes sp.]
MDMNSPLPPKHLQISDDIFADITKAENVEDAATIARRIKEATSVENLTYVFLSNSSFRNKSKTVITTYCDEWQDIYMSNNFLKDDPSVRASFQSILPFDWATIPKMSRKEKKVMALSQEYGVGAYGLSIPVRGLRGELGVLTVTSNQEGVFTGEHRHHHIRTFAQIGTYFHEWFSVESGLRLPSDIPRLSWREKECLAHCANGLMAQRISEKLGISEAAIRLYLSSARHKLQSQTTCGAVAKAIRLGII